jgi:hypothetical protein
VELLPLELEELLPVPPAPTTKAYALPEATIKEFEI